MTINLPPTVEHSLRNAVLNGQFASLDDAMTEAANLLLARLHARPESPQAEESAFEAMQRAGLIGCIQGAADSPTDLSTNPAHMDGFGRA